jgi:hypothetical protein
MRSRLWLRAASPPRLPTSCRMQVSPLLRRIAGVIQNVDAPPRLAMWYLPLLLSFVMVPQSSARSPQRSPLEVVTTQASSRRYRLRRMLTFPLLGLRNAERVPPSARSIPMPTLKAAITSTVSAKMPMSTMRSNSKPFSSSRTVGRHQWLLRRPPPSPTLARSVVISASRMEDTRTRRLRGMHF